MIAGVNMANVIVVVGAGQLGQAIARRVGVGQHILLADLRGTTFHDHAWWERSVFRGQCRFDGAVFHGDAWFGEATFAARTGFVAATFTGHAWFGACTFRGPVDFGTAVFRRSAGFRGATAAGEVGLTGTTFLGAARARTIVDRPWELPISTICPPSGTVPAASQSRLA